MTNPVELIGVFQPKPEAFERFKDLLSNTAAKVKDQEEGCVQYDLFVQTKSRGSTKIIVHEKYIDEKAFEEHLQKQYLVDLLTVLRTEDLLEVEVYIEDAFVNQIAGLNRDSAQH